MAPDIGRIKRQQAFVASLVKKVKSDGLTPTGLLPARRRRDEVAEPSTPGLGTAKQLISFAMSLRNIDLHDTKFATIPWRYQGERRDRPAGRRSAVGRAQGRPHPRRHRRRWHKGGQTRPRPASPASPRRSSGDGVDVAVYNGTATRGLASRAATALTAEHGFTVTGTANAVDRDRADTVIEYGAGLRTRPARTVARLLPGAELNSVPGAGVDVVLGRSYAAQGRASASPASTPTALPTSVARDARSADDDVCSNLSSGATRICRRRSGLGRSGRGRRSTGRRSGG